MSILDIFTPPTLWKFESSTPNGDPTLPEGDDPDVDHITVDVTLRESHDRQAEVTEFPVEEGADITDHRRLKPIALSMNGVITDSPNDVLDVLAGNTTGLVGSTAEKKSDDAYKKLNTLFESKTTLLITTRLKIYKNMVMTSFRIQHDPNTGNCLSFTAEMREIRFASTQFVAIPVDPVVAHTAPPKAKAKVKPKDTGLVGPPEPASVVGNLSILNQISSFLSDPAAVVKTAIAAGSKL